MRLKDNLLSRATHVSLFLMVIGAFFGFAPVANASAGNNNVKIVAWYGAGNLSGSEYDRDTIILFNPTTSDINMTGWTIQTGGTSGAFTTIYTLAPLPAPTTKGLVTPLAPIIKAGGFYAIAGSGINYDTAGNCKGANCYQADSNYDAQLQTSSGYSNTDNDLSSTAAVVALVSENTTVGASCAVAQASTNLVDMVGIEAADGSATVTCYNGGGPAPYTPAGINGIATTSIHGVRYAYGTVRRNRCIDTGNNDVDFTLGYINFQNSSSPVEPCPTGNQLSVAAVATPNNPALNGTFTLTATVTGATNPTSTGLSVTADLTSLGSGYSATTPMYDDGTHGDAVAGDGIYTTTVTMPSANPPSGAGLVLGVNVNVTDSQGNSAVGTAALSIGANVAGPGNNNIVIDAWYGAGNLSKSQYARDTIILFNPTQAPITMTNWSIQIGGSAGAFSAVTYKLPTVTMPAGGFYAIAGSGVAYISGSGCTSTNTVSPCNLNYPYDYQLKTVEGTETNADNDLSSTEETVALVNDQTALGSDCPIGSPHLVDLIGIGAFGGAVPVTCYPGSNYAMYTPNTINGVATDINGLVYPYATVRTNRCGNTFNNANDFELGYIDFENSASTPEPCSSGTQLAVSASAAPSSVGILDPFTITAAVTPASNSTGLAVTADLSNLGLSTATQLYDDGTHGDAVAGDHIYTLATASASGTIGPVPGLAVQATDAEGNKANSNFALTLVPGTLTVTTPVTTVTVAPGGVAIFPFTATGAHGYGGFLSITCTGSPNANDLGIPISTECVTSPPEVTVPTDGTATFQLGIATGTTFSAGTSRSFMLAIVMLLSIGLLTVGIWRRKHLPLATLVALVTLMTIGTAGCGKDAGLANTNAAPGTYTYLMTAQDTSIASVNSTIALTVIVK